MYESCRMWDERIGPIYGKTAEGQAAPLRQIEKRSVELSAIKLSRPIRLRRLLSW